MIVVAGLLVLFVAVMVAVIGVLANSGLAHPLPESFAVFGYHVTGSTGTLFLFGIAVGAMAMLGLSVVLAGAHRTAGLGQAARRDLARSQRETAFANRDRTNLLEHHKTAGDATVHPNKMGLRIGRWSAPRQPKVKP